MPEVDSAPGPAPDAPSPTRVKAKKRETDDPGVALHHELELHLEEERRRAARRRPARAVARSSRSLVAFAALAPILVVVVGATLIWPGLRLAGPAGPPRGSPTALAGAASPSAVNVRLVADVPSPSPSPVATETPRPTLAPTLTPTPLPARCADAELRFPETADSDGAVRTAYRDYLARQGVVIDPSSSLFVGLGEAYASRHAEVVAGWMAVTLQRERRGLAPFPLADYVASDVIVAVGPDEYQFRATISPQGWTEIRSWSAETCEGTFIRNPGNARWVDLMQASVGDITWALPTPRPGR